jgi:glycerol dehydrogenase-like iron-containing ADH family enzyme
MFGLIKGVSRWFLNKPIVYESNFASKWLQEQKDITIISSSHAIEPFKSIISENVLILLNPPLEIDELKLWIPKIHTKWIVGIGGGVIMDTTKYLARESKVKCCLIPSILSTTSWLNMAIALRNKNKLLMAGAFHAHQTIVDPDYILKSPPYMTLAGIADLLCLFSALGDWKIAHQDKGEKISEKAVDEFTKFALSIIAHPELFRENNEQTIRKIYEIFLEALSLCGASLSGRPLEGSEHFLYYCIDELDTRRFIHGNMIAMNILICLRLQGKDALFNPNEIKDFFSKAGIAYNLSANKLTYDDICIALDRIHKFVDDMKLPYSIWNRISNGISEEEKKELVDWLNR